jgi:hypothetical protein
MPAGLGILKSVMQLVDDNSPWSDWIEEYAIVQPLHPGASRLSGRGIGRFLYLGTGPGNHFLAVAATRTATVSAQVCKFSLGIESKLFTLHSLDASRIEMVVKLG